jgi:general secretion pathway protein D
LIQDSKNVTKSGIPLLSRIPLLGALFGAQEYITGKTELIILLTPHIIANQVQSDSVTREFREKLERLKEELKGQEERKMK